MRFTQTELGGAYIIDLELRADARGFFCTSVMYGELGQHGLETNLARINVA
jgi:dTDP-4-dehydrorhamnose 3,5-epimerase